MRIEVIAFHLDHVENASDAPNEHVVEVDAVGRAPFLAENDLDQHLLLRNGVSALQVSDLLNRSTSVISLSRTNEEKVALPVQGI